jgi:hypothetical protein
MSERGKYFDTNLLIAEFMGWTATKYRQTLGGNYNIIEWVDDKEETTHAGGDSWSLTDKEGKDYSPPFHRDWNYLMTVMDKIEGLGYTSSIDKLPVEYRAYFSHKSEGHRNESRIMAVYEEVLDFIGWYNNQSNIK